MRKTIIGAIAAVSLGLTGLVTPVATAAPSETQPEVVTGAPAVVEHSSNARIAGWQDLQFGLFMHWGVYSMFEGRFKGKDQGTGYPEQIKAWMKISDDDYLAEAAKMSADQFDAGAICQMAKDTGMKYVMITSKHHDGFAMWDTKTTDFNVVKKTAFGRDPMKMLQEECNKRDVKLAFYFSIIDWTKHEAEPYSNLNRIDESMMPYIEAQIKELMTNYGPIAEFWFDMGKPTVDQSRRMANWVREAQPETTVVNSRVWNDQGDFEVGGDNSVPTTFGYGPWESILSIFPACWSYCSTYKANRDEGTINHKAIWALDGLIKVISGGGQYAFNIGPKGDGSIDPYDRAVLNKIGQWMQRHPDAITGARATYFPIQGRMRVTTKGNNLYLFPSYWQDGSTLTLPGLANSVTSVTVDGAETTLPFTKDGQDLTVTLRGEEPDELQGVVKVALDGPPAMFLDSTVEVTNGQAHLTDNQIITLRTPKRAGGAAAYDGYVRSTTRYGDVQLSFVFRSAADPKTKYKITFGDQSFVVTGAELNAGSVGNGLTMEPNTVKRIRFEYAEPEYYANALNVQVREINVEATENPGEDLAPAFTTQPESQSATVGDDVAFSASAKARPAATYQWFKKARGAETGTPIVDATGPSLTLRSVELADSGTVYYVEATNAAGTARSNEATLTVEKRSENLARGKKVSQSSTGWGGVPERAIDGNTDGYWDHGSVTHTVGSVSGGWWQVDLGESQKIGKVNVWNRAAESTCRPFASCSERLKDFYVVASQTDLGKEKNIENIRAMEGVTVLKVEGVGGHPSVVNFEGADARFIRVVQPSREALSLAEVEVFAYEKPMVAPTVSAIRYDSAAEGITSAGDGEFRTITVPDGATVTLSVDVTGDPEPDVFWLKRASEESPWDATEETGTTLALTLTAADNGVSYRVMAENEAGEDESGIVTFTVTTPGGSQDDPEPGEQPGGEPGGEPGEEPGDNPGAGSEPGSGEQPGTGTEPGTGEQPGTGVEPGTGEQPGTGAEPGTDPGSGTTPGADPTPGGEPTPGADPTPGGEPTPGTPVTPVDPKPVDPKPVDPKPAEAKVVVSDTTGLTAELLTGSQVTLSASGFTPGEKVTFEIHSNPLVIGTQKADLKGVATLTWTVPANFEVGAHTVYATGETSKTKAQASVKIRKASTGLSGLLSGLFNGSTSGGGSTVPSTTVPSTQKTEQVTTGTTTTAATDDAKTMPSTKAAGKGLAHTGAGTMMLLTATALMAGAGGVLGMRRRQMK